MQGKLPEQVEEVFSLTGSEVTCRSESAGCAAEQRLSCGQCDRKQTECMMGVKRLLLVSLLAFLGKKLPVYSPLIILMVQMFVVRTGLVFPALTHSTQMSDGVRMQHVSQVFLDLQLFTKDQL